MVPRLARLSRRPASNRGFALLITLTLLAFLILLLVGLATYTRVETTISGNAQRQAQAREHALVGLQAALQELQRQLGPDQRVSATAEAFPNRSGTTRYTGVWDATNPTSGPLNWLVSGNEKTANSVTPVTNVAATGVVLVSSATSGTANDIVAPLVGVNTVGVPGVTGTARIGNYAWWVGDQGVKAPVAVADASNAVTYAPYTDTDLRGRIRQQLALGAGAATSGGAAQTEPRDSFNSGLVSGQKISSPAQFALLRNGSNAQLGVTLGRQYFHAWSPNNFSVLANTRAGGLRSDLSLVPDRMGTEVQAWLNYPAYMETASSGGASTRPNPDYSSPPIRRRYVMRPASPPIAPVVSYFLLNFNLRTALKTGTQPVQLRARWLFTFWNPYSSALVPEPMRLDVTGLPTLTADNVTTGAKQLVNLQALLSGSSTGALPMKILLPWPTWTSSLAGDQASWLPGRVYSWTSPESTTGVIPSAGFNSNFYSRNLDADAKQGVQLAVTPALQAGVDDVFRFDGPATTLTVKLVATRKTGDVTLATYTSPAFTSFQTASAKISSDEYQFSFLFRLGESVDGAPWLTSATRDPRSTTLGADAFVFQASASDPKSPSSFTATPSISDTNRLLDRVQTKLDVGKDTPVFEFPRSPVLSLGALQHVALAGQRPFAIGNSWGAGATAGGGTAAQAFDRYFFSGATSAVSVPTSGTLVLPNAGLLVLPRTLAGVTVTKALLQPTGPKGWETAKYALQGGAFNLNSVNATAWIGVLRGVRFLSTGTFRYLSPTTTTGTAADSSVSTIQDGNAQFFRFSQSAQETYALGTAVGAARTDLFRKGMRTLSSSEVASLASNIVALIRDRQARAGSYAAAALSGPFRSLEEFVSLPLDEGGRPLLTDSAGNGQSLLERAIALAKLNASVPEFSSQWLTQADVLTALAPVLFPRSDTFVIRTYGEAVNPMTAAVEGKAWAEAIVQRFPDYVDAADAAEAAPSALTSALNRQQGRRFKVISFRWLTRSDI